MTIENKVVAVVGAEASVVTEPAPYAVLRMSHTAYGAHRGITQQAVSKAVADGRIPAAAIDADGKIDVAAADLALDGNRLRLDEPREGVAGPIVDQAVPATGETAALTRARTASEEYRARIAELDLLERTREVRPFAEVREAAERIGITLMRELELIPTMADDLQAASARGGVEGIRSALKVKTAELCRALSSSMSALAAGDQRGNQ